MGSLSNFPETTEGLQSGNCKASRTTFMTRRQSFLAFPQESSNGKELRCVRGEPLSPLAIQILRMFRDYLFFVILSDASNARNGLMPRVSWVLEYRRRRRARGR